MYEEVRNLIYKLDELKEKQISVIQDGDYTKLYYTIFSNFNDPEVRYCRGVTFYKDQLVACPFFKFGNYGEGYADEIDWASARVLDKIDGTLISLWFHGEFWHISTNKMIDAFKGDMEQVIPEISGDRNATWGELAAYALKEAGVEDLMVYGELDKNYTYIFELVSPYNKIVIPYDKIDIYHIGTRDNRTLEEVELDIGVQKPTSYPLQSLEDCVNAAVALGRDKEGFVVVDKYYHRIKVKSPLYFELHRMHNNGQLSMESAVTLIITGEDEEFLSYFPEQKAKLDLVRKEIEEIKRVMRLMKSIIWDLRQKDKKQFALAVNATSVPFKDYFFKWYNSDITIDEYLQNIPAKRIADYIKKEIHYELSKEVH